jgi:hypothetical protein
MTSEDYHGMHQDEANRVRALKRHEAQVRARERARTVAFLCTPYLAEDPDFPGCFHDQAPYPAPISEAL